MIGVGAVIAFCALSGAFVYTAYVMTRREPPEMQPVEYIAPQYPWPQHSVWAAIVLVVAGLFALTLVTCVYVLGDSNTAKSIQETRQDISQNPFVSCCALLGVGILFTAISLLAVQYARVAATPMSTPESLQPDYVRSPELNTPLHLVHQQDHQPRWVQQVFLQNKTAGVPANQTTANETRPVVTASLLAHKSRAGSKTQRK
eukprot:CAMPEP_0204253234 /NCGR_PEP_ID=MMETSP0468-20130131/1752_1 /ASSEMBLY_ACC=CAM_ASM_000383 /TAXON_ID=2969 /ORGANISM="Oxyrrhis marina" /LENGTH=201 /DNA_ID=CAMNT_0051226783 /DNA_START=159 /DNA_END=764 /DNA_ORIENTATION=+